jgi:ABC-type protease/lipase transport system fused ATPase/permease subunit
MPEIAEPGRLSVTRSRIFRSGFGAGLMSAAGALFIMVLYGRLIPSGSLPALAITFGGVAGLLIVQGLLRYFSGQMADRAGSAIYFRIRSENGEEQAERFVPVLRALRGRAFVSAADLAWVPVFLAIAGFIHPAFAILAILFSAVFYRLGQSEPLTPTSRLDGVARERDRWRRNLSSTARDVAQIGLLGLGGVLAIMGMVHIGELVAATMLSMRALAAVQMAAEERAGISAAWKSWRALPRD